MKKYLILVILLFSLNSCWIGYNPADFSEPVIISRCQISSVEGYTDYYGFTTYSPGTCLSLYYTFRDKTGKFNVGDTIKLVK